jgi:DNA-binding NarL/FixJ family response regulator
VAGDQDEIRVLLADEQSLFREAVKVVLSAEDDLVVVGEAHDGLQAVAEAERVRPDVALLDANLPNCDGIRATEQISVRVPDCRVIVFSGQEDEHVLVRALEAGASGYLSKESPLADLIDATRAVHRGEALVPPRMLGALLQRLIHRRRERDDALRRMAKLTRREREVLALLAQGADNDGIAQQLVISPETARTHIQNVLGKLGVHSRLEAAAFVTQNGILNDLAGAAR